MGKKKTRRGKPGGKRRFLRGLTRELNATREFDPSLWWDELPPILPPTEEPSNPVSQTPYIPPPRDVQKEILEFRRRAARAIPSLIPERIPTRPIPPSIYTKKSSQTQRALRIISNIETNLRIQRTSFGFTIININ